MVNSCEFAGGFDGQAFRHEFDSVLLDGMEEMKKSADKPITFFEAYQDLNKSLADVVDRWKPPRSVIEETRARAIEDIGNLITELGVDVGPYCEPDLRRLCISIMKSTGGYDSNFPKLDTIIEDTLTHLQEKGRFTIKESKNLIRDLMRFDTLDMKAIVNEIGSNHDARYSDFLRFLDKCGTASIKEDVSKALFEMLSSESKPIAVVRKMNLVPWVPIKPLRQG